MTRCNLHAARREGEGGVPLGTTFHAYVQYGGRAALTMVSHALARRAQAARRTVPRSGATRAGFPQKSPSLQPRACPSASARRRNVGRGPRSTHRAPVAQRFEICSTHGAGGRQKTRAGAVWDRQLGDEVSTLSSAQRTIPRRGDTEKAGGARALIITVQWRGRRTLPSPLEKVP